MPDTPPKTELVCLIDRSGSMQSTREDAQGGFNQFISDQKKLGLPCKVTLHQFDNYFETVWERQNLVNVGEYVLKPRGGTALLDALGRTINMMSPKPDRNVIVVVVTDGGENASCEFSLAQIKSMVEAKQALDWSFVFIGAGIDAFAHGATLGFHSASTMAVADSSFGYRTAYAGLSNTVTRSRLAGTAAEFNEEEIDLAESTKKS